VTVGHGCLFPALADENAGRANVIAQASAQPGQWQDMIQRWRGRQFNLYGKNLIFWVDTYVNIKV